MVTFNIEHCRAETNEAGLINLFQKKELCLPFAEL